MATILHLSDLHLAPQGMGEDEIGDYTKSEIIRAADRQTRRRQLEDTLGNLGVYLRSAGGHLDAVVISGDITYHCREDGFALLDGLLERLGESRPSNDRILVVPGNHDVARGSPPSSGERYALFQQYVGANGFVTPLLDGIDLNSDGQTINGDHLPYLLLDEGRVLVLGLSSVNYCQVEQVGDDSPVWAEVREALSGADPSLLARFTKVEKSVRYVDVARVSHGQMAAAESILQRLRAEQAPVIVMVVLHHHLLPITAVEEVKPFDSLVNLGEFRQFLRENNVDIVLHGHKHVSSVYWDYVQGQHDDREQRVLVCASATPHSGAQPDNEVCRILTLSTARRFAPELRITAITPDQLTEASWKRNSRIEILAPYTRLRDGLVFEADTAEQVYQRVVAVLEAKPSHVAYNIMCTIQRAGSASQMPDGYPDLVSGAEEHSEWFHEIVRWWQSDQPSMLEGYRFRHGERLRRFGGPRTNQLEAVVAVLCAGDGSGKAIATLIDPIRDDITMESDKFPAFSLVQFTTDHSDGGLRLNCVGYFRHQEMRAWWPINVAELEYLQRTVLESVRARPNGPLQILPGYIATFTAFAQLAEGTRPRVAVPLVDRTAEEDTLRLWKMAYALAWPEMPKRDDALADWKLMAQDWMPLAEQYEKYGVPIAKRGLDDLERFLGFFTRINPNRMVSRAADKLRTLSLQNETFQRDEHKETSYSRWRASTIRATRELLDVINDESLDNQSR